LKSSDPTDRPKAADPQETPPQEAAKGAAEACPEADTAQTDPAAQRPGRRILIGSQRDPEAYRPKPPRDWIGIEEPDSEQTAQQGTVEGGRGKAEGGRGTVERQSPPSPVPLPPSPKIPTPSVRDRLSPEEEEEFNTALGGASAEELMTGGDPLAGQPLLESESRHTGHVVAVHHDDVFVELGGRHQGCLPLKHFDHPPQPATTLEVIVKRFNPEDGLYELTIPGMVVEVEDWDELSEGMLVEARVTGHNSGGLECEVNHIRGFIPAGQVSRKLLDSLQPGQVHEGVVRKILDFGAFVDIGGIDGLVHVSRLGWGRVDHPGDVLTEGQTIQVKVEKIDRTTGKISLAYRDVLESPWTGAEKKYPKGSLVRGTVTKLMDFGAFVELEPGVEGLVHISELSHRRVWRTSDILGEGQQVEVLVLSVDSQAQRMSLSVKALSQPEPAKQQQQPDAGEPSAKSSKRKKPPKPLQGGLGRSAGGEQSGDWGLGTGG